MRPAITSVVRYTFRYHRAMHTIQKILLSRLLASGKLSFASLTRGYDYEDNVVFHLKQLHNKHYVDKSEHHYMLTSSGIKAITHYDLPTLDDTGYKTVITGFLCEYKGRYLIKEHPQASVNFYNLPSGKPHFGEPIEHALQRAFMSISSLELSTSAFTFTSLHLKTVKASGGDVLFDDAFAIYHVTLTDNDQQNVKLPDSIHWMTKGHISALPNRWPELDMCILENESVPYRSYEFVSDYILE